MLFIFLFSTSLSDAPRPDIVFNLRNLCIAAESQGFFQYLFFEIDTGSFTQLIATDTEYYIRNDL